MVLWANMLAVAIASVHLCTTVEARDITIAGITAGMPKEDAISRLKSKGFEVEMLSVGEMPTLAFAEPGCSPRRDTGSALHNESCVNGNASFSAARSEDPHHEIIHVSLQQRYSSAVDPHGFIAKLHEVYGEPSASWQDYGPVGFENLGSQSDMRRDTFLWRHIKEISSVKWIEKTSPDIYDSDLQHPALLVTAYREITYEGDEGSYVAHEALLFDLQRLKLRSERKIQLIVERIRQRRKDALDGTILD